jgi:hypothetical protein
MRVVCIFCIRFGRNLERAGSGPRRVFRRTPSIPPHGRYHSCVGWARRTALTASSSFDRNRERSLGVIGAGPLVTTPLCRKSSISLHIASASPMLLSVRNRPFGLRGTAPFARQRAARGRSAVTAMCPSPLRDPVVNGAEAGADDRLHQRIGRRAQRGVGHDPEAGRAIGRYSGFGSTPDARVLRGVP